MSTTEQTAKAERAKQIRERLNEIAPYPAADEATTGATLARWLAMRSAVKNHQQLAPDTVMRRSEIDLLTILFAAAHALYALDELDPDAGRRVALEIRSAWDDGAGVGEWLWEHLGSAACAELGPLADDLAALSKPADGLLAHAGTIQRALDQAAMEARSEEFRQPYREARLALEAEIDKQGEAAR